MKTKKNKSLLNSLVKRNIISITVPYIMISIFIIFLVFNSFVRDNNYRNNVLISNMSEFINNNLNLWKCTETPRSWSSPIN